MRHKNKKAKELWLAYKKDNGVTQEWMAEHMGLGSQAAFSAYINGHCPINATFALAFSRIVKCHPSQLHNIFNNHPSFPRLSENEQCYLDELFALNDEDREFIEQLVKSKDSVIIKRVTKELALRVQLQHAAKVLEHDIGNLTQENEQLKNANEHLHTTLDNYRTIWRH